MTQLLLYIICGYIYFRVQAVNNNMYCLPNDTCSSYHELSYKGVCVSHIPMDVTLHVFYSPTRTVILALSLVCILDKPLRLLETFIFLTARLYVMCIPSILSGLLRGKVLDFEMPSFKTIL